MRGFRGWHGWRCRAGLWIGLVPAGSPGPPLPTRVGLRGYKAGSPAWASGKAASSPRLAAASPRRVPPRVALGSRERALEGAGSRGCRERGRIATGATAVRSPHPWGAFPSRASACACPTLGFRLQLSEVEFQTTGHVDLSEWGADQSSPPCLEERWRASGATHACSMPVLSRGGCDPKPRVGETRTSPTRVWSRRAAAPLICSAASTRSSAPSWGASRPRGGYRGSAPGPRPRGEGSGLDGAVIPVPRPRTVRGRRGSPLSSGSGSGSGSGPP